jgi:tetratricopeptide (TPR) repeat protein
MYRVAIVFGLIVLLVAPMTFALADEQPGVRLAAAPKFEPPRLDPSQLDDFPTPLVPRQARTQAEEDRVTASALFAHGRMLVQRGDLTGALRRYQRAWRYDPQAVPILSDIVAVAIQLNRAEEAARYAVIAAEKESDDAELLMRLAVYLTQQSDWPRALKLYERARTLRKDAAKDASSVLISIEMGRLYFLTGDYQKSAESFAIVRDALDNPDRYGLNDALKKTLLDQADRTYSLFGESFLLAERLDDAAAMFKKADELKPNKGSLALQLARVEAKRGNTDAALKHLDEYFQSKLSDAGTDPYELLAELLQKQIKDPQQAQRELRERLEKTYAADAENGPLGFFLAKTYREAGELDQAAKVYEALLKSSPAVDVYQGLIDVRREQGQIDKLLETLGQAVVKTGTLEPLGESAEAITGDDALLGKLIERAKAQKQADVKSLAAGVPLAVALLALEGKQFDTADEFIELALTEPEPPKAQLLASWGLQLFMADEPARAAGIFRRAIDEKVLPENNPAFYFYLAGALELSGKTDEALEAAKRALALQPKNARFKARIPWIMYHAKRYEEAEKGYLKLVDELDANHNSPDVRDAMRETRLILSNICVQQDRLPESEEWLEQVLDEFPEDIGALNDLGYLWADQGKRLDRALAMVEKAVQGEPENMAYRDSLGWALFRLARYGEAVEELEKAAAGEDPDAVILDHLGDAYLKAKQIDKAIAAWRRAAEALKKDKDDKKLQAVEAKIKEHAK